MRHRRQGGAFRIGTGIAVVHEFTPCSPQPGRDFPSRGCSKPRTVLFDAGTFDDRPRLTLVNAIYFRGTWENQFDPRVTRQEDFRSPTGLVRVAMMHRTGLYGYAEAESLQVLRLPCTGENLSLLVMLPGESDSSAG